MLHQAAALRVLRELITDVNVYSSALTAANPPHYALLESIAVYISRFVAVCVLSITASYYQYQCVDAWCGSG